MSVGKTIGAQLSNGFPGKYAIQPDMLISAAISDDENMILFGVALQYTDTTKTKVKTMATGAKMDDFAGISAADVRTNFSTPHNEVSNSGYNINDTVSVFQRGSISVLAGGSVKRGDSVSWDPAKGFVNTGGVAITNAKFEADALEGEVTAITLLTKANI